MLSSQESLAEKFVNKWFWLYFFTFLIWPLGYIIKVIISRDLSVEEVGILYGIISFVSLLSAYNDLGCTESMSYFLPKYLVKKEYGKIKYILFLVIFSQVVTSILIYIILFIFAPWLSIHYFHSDVTEILRMAGFFFIGVNLLQISTTFFLAVQDTKLQKWSELVRIWMTAIGAMILFFGSYGNIERYMIIWLIGLLVAIIFSWYFSIKKYYLPFLHKVSIERDHSLRKDFLQYAFATLLTANIGMLLSQIDMQLIIYLRGIKDAWYYSTYLSLIGIPFMFLAPIISFLFPVISELSGRNEEYKIEALVKRFWTYFGIIGIWAWFFFFQFWERLSILFFWEKFRESWNILAFSAPFLVFNLLLQIAFQVLAGTGQVKKRTKILLITLMVNILLNLLLIPLYWPSGSALAVWLSWIPLYFMSIKATNLSLPIFWDISWYKNIIAGLFTFLLIHFLREEWNHFPYFSDIFLAILLYMSIFFFSNKTILLDAKNTIMSVRRKDVLMPSDSTLSR